MFNFDILNNPEPFHFYLCKPDGSMVCQLNGIDEDTASITISLNNQHQLSFDYMRHISSDGNLVETNGYHSLETGMLILVEKIGFFKMKYSPMKFDGSKEFKSVTAYSIECELESKDLTGFKINTGEDDSLEYLVKYDDDETESLINDYGGIPYDYIVFYNTYPEQLSSILNKYPDGTYTDDSSIGEIKRYCDLIPRLKRKLTTDGNGNTSLTEYAEYTYDSAGETVISVHLSGFNERVSRLISFYEKYREQLSLICLAIEKCGCNWSVGTIDSSLANKKYQFDVDGENIYSFLTNDVAGAANCVFSFDLFTRKINAVLIENIGKESGVVIDRYNLLNSLEVSCEDDSVYTRFSVSGGNGIGIQYVNFGNSRIDDLSYFLNARDENNNRIYVSDELAEKYGQFAADRDAARETYIGLTKTYNQALADIDEIKYRVPNDSLQNDWDTFTDTELENSLISYNQLMATLQSLYKEDYGSAGCNNDGSVNENFIKNTEYWHDYYAYKITIEQIKAAIEARARGIKYKDITNEQALSLINAYKTEWSLYGTVELENKIAAYDNSMKVLVDGEAVILKPDSKIAKQWSELSTDEKTEYGNIESEYRYSIYMDLYDEKESCQSYLNELLSQLNDLEKIRDNAREIRNALVGLVTLETYDRKELGKIVALPSSTISAPFTEDEIKTIYLLYTDKNYSNENMLATSLDTSVSEIDIQYELLEDAKKQLSIESQPQISFKTDIENLLCIPEFQSFDFNVGNYVTVEYYDDYYVSLRLREMTFNPCIPESELSVSFTNYIRSNSERLDTSYILGQAAGGSSGGGSSGGGGSGNPFGSDDKIDTTISNTMLAKLLNTEMFGTRVSNVILDTIKANEITAKYARFEGLAKGTTVIDGKCIMTGHVIDQHYDGDKSKGDIGNTKGSIINLETGKFNFGGGALKYDGASLSVKGAVSADTGFIGGKDGFVIAPGKMYSNGHSIYNSTKEGVYIGTDYISLGNGGVTYFKNDGTGKIGSWNINSSSIWNGKSPFASPEGMYFGTDGLSITDKFKIWSNGSFNFGDGKLVFDGSKLAFGSDVTLSWGQIDGADENVTQITKDTIQTENIVAENLKVKAANISGQIIASQINTAGLIAENISAGTISGKTITGGKIEGTKITSDSIIAINKIKILNNDQDHGVTIEVTTGGNTDMLTVSGEILTGHNITAGGLEVNGIVRLRNWDPEVLGKPGEQAITAIYKDDFAHGVISVDSDLLKTGIGWGGDGGDGKSYNTVLNLRGKTVVAPHNSGVTVKSDERLKNSFKPLDEFDSVYMDIEPCAFKYNNGTSGRYHFGVKAQDVKKAFEKHGYTTQDFGGFVQMRDDPENVDYCGVDDPMGIIYTEFVMWNMQKNQMQQKEIEFLKHELQEQRKKIDILNQALQG